MLQNKRDIEVAKKKINKNLIARLEISKKTLNSIVKTVIDISRLKDPVGIILEKWQRPNGLKIKKYQYQ